MEVIKQLRQREIRDLLGQRPIRTQQELAAALRERGLAGESGCGKSTLGNGLVRMDVRMRQLGGRVGLDGKELPISDTKAMRNFRFKEVSIVPQYAMSALNPTRRVGKMVAELLKSRGFDYKTALPELERRVKLVGLDADILKRYPIELSGGMKQRVVMIISTLLNPSLLIADEVTSALDVSTQRAVGEMLLEFRDRKFAESERRPQPGGRHGRNAHGSSSAGASPVASHSGEHERDRVGLLHRGDGLGRKKTLAWWRSHRALGRLWFVGGRAPVPQGAGLSGDSVALDCAGEHGFEEGSCRGSEGRVA